MERATPPRLSAAAVARISAAELEVTALRALSELAQILDREGVRSRWDIAGEVAARLSRFEAATWLRIRRGAREPRNHAEELLCAICRSGLPRSRERIYGLLD